MEAKALYFRQIIFNHQNINQTRCQCLWYHDSKELDNIELFRLWAFHEKWSDIFSMQFQDNDVKGSTIKNASLYVRYRNPIPSCCLNRGFHCCGWIHYQFRRILGSVMTRREGMEGNPPTISKTCELKNTFRNKSQNIAAMCDVWRRHGGKHAQTQSVSSSIETIYQAQAATAETNSRTHIRTHLIHCSNTCAYCAAAATRFTVPSIHPSMHAVDGVEFSHWCGIKCKTYKHTHSLSLFLSLSLRLNTRGDNRPHRPAMSGAGGADAWYEAYAAQYHHKHWTVLCWGCAMPTTTTTVAMTTPTPEADESA